MAADKQYADALKTLEFIESRFMSPGKFTTYGAVCKALGYEPARYARHVGQVCSLIDAACYWAKLPFLSAEKVRTDAGEYNQDSFGSEWAPLKHALIEIAAARAWTQSDIAKIRSTLNHINGEGALSQWERIDKFGKAEKDRALTHK